MNKELSKDKKCLLELAWCFGSRITEPIWEKISLSEFQALHKVENCTPFCPVWEIGRELCMTKSGATRLVKRLMKKGFVDQCCVTEDKRIRGIILTESGRQAILLTKEKYSKAVDNIFETFGEKTRAEVVKCFERLGDLLGSSDLRDKCKVAFDCCEIDEKTGCCK